MIINQEIEENADNLTITNHINTDDEEKINWKQRQQGKGFIYDKYQHLAARQIALIPVEEAAMLEALGDIDYLSFSLNGDKNALRRLLKRYPHWQSCEGSI